MASHSKRVKRGQQQSLQKREGIVYDVTFTTSAADNSAPRPLQANTVRYGRMFKFLQTDAFDAVFSFILALGCMALLKPICREKECQVQKAPPFEEVKTSTYQMGSKCYKFHIEYKECPDAGAIEPFERFIR